MPNSYVSERICSELLWELFRELICSELCNVDFSSSFLLTKILQLLSLNKMYFIGGLHYIFGEKATWNIGIFA